MGKKARKRPQHLGRKLREIRDSLELSQGLMLAKLGFPASDRNNLSNYETGKREAPSDLVLAYAKVVGINMELLHDDERELPKAVRAAAVKNRKKRSEPRTRKK